MIQETEQLKTLYKQYGTTQPTEEYELIDGQLVSIKEIVDKINRKILELECRERGITLK